jgi:pimeloyl-ACP methyl ester carboxylesterase
MPAPHLLPLGPRERAALLPDRIRDGKPTQILESRGHLEPERGLRVETQTLRGGLGEPRHPARVAVRPGHLQIGQVPESGRYPRQLRHLDLYDRLGLSLENALAGIARAGLVHEPIRVRGEGLDERGVQDPAGAAPQRLDRSHAAAQMIEARRIRGGPRDAGRERDLLASKTLRRTVAVPPLDGLMEGPLDTRPEPHALRRGAAHLTASGVEAPAEIPSPRGGVVLEPGALRGAHPPGQLRQQRRSDVSGIGDIRLCHRAHQYPVVAEGGGRLVRLGAAAHVHQQRRVKRVGDVVLGQPLLARERRRDQARSHCLLRRQPEPEIRRYRETADQIGEPESGTHAQSLASAFRRPDALFRSQLNFWRWLPEVAPSERAFFEAFFTWVYTPRAHANGSVDQIVEEALAFPHQQSVEAFQAQVDVCLTHDTADRLAEIAAPTLVLSGELDTILPPRFGRAVAAGIPNARFDVMAGEAHQPFQEVPDEFNARVDAFWRQVEGRG